MPTHEMRHCLYTVKLFIGDHTMSIFTNIIFGIYFIAIYPSNSFIFIVVK